jgi:hypothetical protein
MVGNGDQKPGNKKGHALIEHSLFFKLMNQN